MPAALHPSTTVRLAGLLGCVLAWCWLWSVHTPWAADTTPRLWLYDLLFYARVLLAAWVLVECALWYWHPRRRTRIGTVFLAATVLTAAAAWALAATGAGWRWRVVASARALDALATAGTGDIRQRAGQVLVDTVRFPCDAGTPWFWLGRPHGGGSGINLAIVRSASLPQAPFADAFRLRRIDGQWWMAYQRGTRYQTLQARNDQSGCRAPGTITSHRAGLAFIDAG